MRCLIIFLLTFALIFTISRVQAEEDDDVTIEDEMPADDVVRSRRNFEDANAAGDEGGDEEETNEGLISSPDVELRYTILQPVQSSADVQLKATDRARLLIGFSNRGSQSFLVQAIDSSFRYSHDYNHILQNHTVRRFDQIVPAGYAATFDYSFFVHEFFAGRSFYLTVTVYYRGEDASSQFRGAVFNSTLKVEEDDSGFDAETFFMYLAFAAILVLLGVLLAQAVRSAGLRVVPKTGMPRNAPNRVELGTENRKGADVDYQWISPETLQHVNAAKGGKSRGKKGAIGSSSGSDSDAPAASRSGKQSATRRKAASKNGGNEDD